jgi:AcrR family transcriptional regulator
MLTAAKGGPGLIAEEPLSGDVDRVLEAALRLVDAEGLEALTMRRLAQDMGIEAMSLYRYTPTHDALVGALAETVMSQLAVPEPSFEWQSQLRAIAHDFRRLTLLHPNVVPILVTRPLLTPLAFRPLRALRYLERFLQLLTNAGFAITDILPISRSFFGFLYGHVLTEMHQAVIDRSQTDQIQQPGLQDLPAESFPVMHMLANRLDAYDGAVDLDRGLDTLILAISHQLPGPNT